MGIVPRSAWIEWSHLLIWHGRAVCISRAPRCSECVLLDLCPEGQARVAVRHAPGTFRDRPGAGRAPTLAGMDRLDLELYADRLARHASRLADELAAARLRLTWAELERAARAELGAGRSLLLESLGVLAQVDASAADEALLARRREQLEALAALQVYVERTLSFAVTLKTMPLASCESGVPANSEQNSFTGPAATSTSSTASAPEASGTVCSTPCASTTARS